MDLLFKFTTAPTDKPKVGETNFEDHYPDIYTNMSWPSLSPYIEQATSLYIIPFIGQDIYDDITAKYQAGTALGTNQINFLKKLQDSIAYFSIYMALPMKNAVISDMGIQETSGKDHTSTPVSQWRFKILRKETGAAADRLLDDLLRWLETTQSDPYFDAWRTFEALTNNTSALFRTTKQLNDHMRINNSRRTFIAMLPFIQKAQDRYLVPNLCQEQIDDLHTDLAADTITTIQNKLIKLCRRVLAEKALEMAIPHLTLQLTANGFQVSTYSDGMDSKRSISAGAELSALADMKHQAEMDGDTAIADLIQFLYINKDNFPIWKSSSCYHEDIDQSKKIYTPTDGVGGIMM